MQKSRVRSALSAGVKSKECTDCRSQDYGTHQVQGSGVSNTPSAGVVVGNATSAGVQSKHRIQGLGVRNAQIASYAKMTLLPISLFLSELYIAILPVSVLDPWKQQIPMCFHWYANSVAVDFCFHPPPIRPVAQSHGK